MFAAGVLLAAAIYFDVKELLLASLSWVARLGPWGAVAFIGLYILATVLFVPGLILTLGAGFLFGVLRGSIYVSIASTLGASAAFLIGRHLARQWVSSKIKGNEKFTAIDQAVAKEGWKIVGLLRLSPVFPFKPTQLLPGTHQGLSQGFLHCLLDWHDARYGNVRLPRFPGWRSRQPGN